MDVAKSVSANFLLIPVDADGDGYYSVASGGNDCDDSDARAHPNQTMFFTTQRISGGFDYNCDTIETRQFPNIGNCAFMSGTCTLTPGWVSTVPPCGQAANQIIVRHTCPRPRVARQMPSGCNRAAKEALGVDLEK